MLTPASKKDGDAGLIVKVAPDGIVRFAVTR